MIEHWNLLHIEQWLHSAIISWNFVRELNQTLSCTAHWTVYSMSCYFTKPFISNKLNTELSFALHTDWLQSFHCHFTKLCKRIHTTLFDWTNKRNHLLNQDKVCIQLIKMKKNHLHMHSCRNQLQKHSLNNRKNIWSQSAYSTEQAVETLVRTKP